jgi:HK97 gp10 family phage protein
MALSYRITDAESRPQRRAKDFVARMARIPEKVKRRLNAANEQSAEELAAMMTRLAPKTKQGGDLVASIRYFEVTGVQGGGIAWRVTAGDNDAFYARMVEFGAARGSTPRPFFYPSVRALRRLIRNRQLRAFRQGLKDADPA